MLGLTELMHGFSFQTSTKLVNVLAGAKLKRIIPLNAIGSGLKY
jgi:hypothetical protein